MEAHFGITSVVDAQLELLRGVWQFLDKGLSPVIVLSESPQNGSTLVTTAAEHLAAEQIQGHFPHRYDEIPPAIFLELSVEEHTPVGGERDATWDRLTYHP